MVDRWYNLLPGERLLYSILAAGVVLLPFVLWKWVFNPKYYNRFHTRPNGFLPFDFILLLLVWLTINYVFSSMAGLFTGGTKMVVKLAAILVTQLIIIPLELYICKQRFFAGLRERGLGLTKKHLYSDAILAVACIIIVLPVCNVLASTMTYWLKQFPQIPLHQHVLLQDLMNVGVGGKILIIISAVVGAPFFEELFFRGILQSMLRRVMSPWPAILITGAIFTVVHQEIQNWPSLLLLAAALGWAYEKTGRITLPIMIHALFNAVYITAYLLGVPKIS